MPRKKRTKPRGNRIEIGQIDSNEMRSVGFAEKGKLQDHAPIEAVKGVGKNKAHDLRAKGVSDVKALKQQKESSSREAELKILEEEKQQRIKRIAKGEVISYFKYKTEDKNFEESYKSIMKDSVNDIYAQYFTKKELKEFFELAKEMKAKEDKEREIRERKYQKIKEEAEATEKKYNPIIKEYLQTTKPTFEPFSNIDVELRKIINEKYPETEDVYNRAMIRTIYDEIIAEEEKEHEKRKNIIEEMQKLRDKDKETKDKFWWSYQPEWSEKYNREAYRNLHKEYRYAREFNKKGDKLKINTKAVKVVKGLNKKGDKIKTEDLIIIKNNELPLSEIPEGTIFVTTKQDKSGRYRIDSYYLVLDNSVLRNKVSLIRFTEKEKVIDLLKK